MKERKNYLQSLDSEEAELAKRERQLTKKREFYNKCQVFCGQNMESVLKCIVPMIGKIEGEEYVDHTFSMTEDDRYETEWVSPFEGQYGVSGAELDATAEPRTVLAKGNSFRTRIILDKATCDTFLLLRFSTCRDYKANLSRLLSTKKYFEIKKISLSKTKRLEIIGIGFTAETFEDMFPYVAIFLERLADWRLENETEKIPVKVMEDISSKVIEETLTKKQSGLAKVAKKND